MTPRFDVLRLARDPARRRAAEIGFWAAVLAVQAVINTLVVWTDLRRFVPDTPLLRPAVLELTSTAVIALLIPLLIAFERRVPLRADTWRRHLPLHLAGSVAFCGLHVAGMVGLRHVVFGALGEPYEPPGAWRLFGYEYLKDVRTYVLVLLALWAYRLFLLRLQGEARLLDAPDPPVVAAAAPGAAPPAEAPAAPASLPARPERFLVRKLRKEFLIAATDIEWVQAEGNYVGLRVNGHDYLLRSTLAEFERQLDPARFARVHRSYVVNLDRIAEIEPLDSGDARLTMAGGGVVPCSRRYRDALSPGR